nr:40S ribosomal protein S2-like [Pan troglodytes]
MLQGGGHCHLQGHHHPGQTLDCPRAQRLLGEQDRQALRRPLQGDRPLRLCAGAPRRAPRSTGIVLARVPKKLLMMTGIDDCYTSARGCTATLGNFTKATFDAIFKTYNYLTPDLWKETVFTKSPYREFTDHLVKTHTRVSVQRTRAPAVATT